MVRPRFEELMARNRFFVENITAETILSGEQFRHAKTVLRLNIGDEVVLFDGTGEEYTGILSMAERGTFTVHVTGKRASDREPETDILLLVGALKGDKTELVVQKATELGANRIGVFSSRYCSAYMNDNKLARLNRVAQEAAKQCLRACVPEIVYFDRAEEAFRSGEEYGCKLFACEFLEKSDGEIPKASSYALVVGSEGGFSEEEFELAKSLGYVGISLGKRILRAETAAIALLSVTAYRSGEWK